MWFFILQWLQPIKMEHLKWVTFLQLCCWGVFATCLHRRFRSYRALKEDVMISANQQSSRANICSGASTVWNLLNRRGAVDHCPLLQDRPVWTFTTHPNATKQHRFRLLSIFLYFFFYTFSKRFKCHSWDLNQYCTFEMSLFWIFCTRTDFVSFGQSDLECCSNKHDENISFVSSGFINLKEWKHELI